MEAVETQSLKSIQTTGYRNGYQHTRICQFCGNVFQLGRRASSKVNGGKYCSRSCKSRSRIGIPTGRPISFTTPESTKPQRIRANGLINARLRDGRLVRPTTCAKCHRPCKPDSHHPDYSMPQRIAWLCRSCHMKCHHNPSFERGCISLCVDTGAIRAAFSHLLPLSRAADCDGAS